MHRASMLLVLVLTSTLPAQIGRGGICSQNALASEVGAETLRRGGNAVDAAVATAFALAVVHPAAGNIGGGGFMVVAMADGSKRTFDFREEAPAKAHPGMFLEGGLYSEDRHHESHVAVGVPGTVAGLWLAHRTLGKLPWRDLVAPAIALARDGFGVPPGLAADLERLRRRLQRHAATKAAFYKSDGRSFAAGERLRQLDLARTLERIADRGPDGFYRGETADLIVAEMRRGGGLITHEDLAAYRPRERPPLIGSHRGRTIVTMGPPSSGGITLLSMLATWARLEPPRSEVERAHLLAEVMRGAFAERARFLADPEFAPTAEMFELLEPARAARRAAAIDREHAGKSRLEDATLPANEGENTTHLSVVDRHMNAVSLTYTLEDSYGSAIVVPGAGFLLNNEMGDFNAAPGLTDERGRIGTAPNLAAPGKRMLSSMTPTIIMDGTRPIFVVGTPGGRTIINTVFQIVLHVLEDGMGIQSAVDASRLHHQWFPDRIVVEEPRTSSELIRGLEKLGHTIHRVQYMGAAECLAVIDDGAGGRKLVGGVDPRAPDGGFASQ